jgi:hypothetical protein
MLGWVPGLVDWPITGRYRSPAHASDAELLLETMSLGLGEHTISPVIAQQAAPIPAVAKLLTPQEELAAQVKELGVIIKTRPKEHPDIGTSMGNLAVSYVALYLFVLWRKVSLR